MGATYQQAGVSIDAGNELVRRIKKMVSKNPLARKAIGGFSGLYPLPKPLQRYSLSGCCDGVGTKLKIAFLMDKHDTVGIDLVAMNVNDLVCAGARPLFFLDYFACGKLEVDVAEKVIQGIQAGCDQAGCILLGGETAEMPGFYAEGEYDLAGFAVGMVEDKDILAKRKAKEGDVVIGLPSSGVHSNGYSLVREVFSEREQMELGLDLLRPTKIYVKEVLNLLYHKDRKIRESIRGIAHITGGGWYENIPRVFSDGVQAELKMGSWPILDIFKKIQEKGDVSHSEMFRTFNMGIGLVLIIDKLQADRVRRLLKPSYILGTIKKGKSGVVLS